MSLAWTVLGTLGQMLLAYFLFMVVAFSGGGLVNGATLGKLQTLVLNLALFVLPGACVASAVVVIGLNIAGAGTRSYLWYLLPFAVTVVYVAYAIVLVRRQR